MLDMERPAVLQLEQVVKKYPVSGGELTAVNGVNITVRQGETVAVVRESGCGKSTVVRMAAGIESVTAGSIRVMGKEIASPGGHLARQQWKQLRRDVQLVLQNPSGAVSPRMQMDRFMREPFVNWRLCSRQQIDSSIRELLKQVELDATVLDKFPHQLSGGELQRMVIARALAVSPSLLICDEPTSALDVSVQAQVTALLRRLHQERGMAMLFVSHDLALVSQFADRVVVMYCGQIVEELPASLLGQAVHPYTKELLDAVSQIGKAKLPVTYDSFSSVSQQQGCSFLDRCPVSSSVCKRASVPLREYHPGHWVSCLKVNLPGR